MLMRVVEESTEIFTKFDFGEEKVAEKSNTKFEMD